MIDPPVALHQIEGVAGAVTLTRLPGLPTVRARRRMVERVAQLVEQLTFNQQVQGSSPCALTNKISWLPLFHMKQNENVRLLKKSHGETCSRFQHAGAGEIARPSGS